MAIIRGILDGKQNSQSFPILAIILNEHWEVSFYPLSIYIGLIIPGERLLLKLPKAGLIVGGVGSDFGFGAGQRLKFVVLPLKALILRENFAEEVSEAKELSLEFGFKLII
jgi:hypothetical protein